MKRKTLIFALLWLLCLTGSAFGAWPGDWGAKKVLTIDRDGGDYLPDLCSTGTLAYFPIPLTEDNFPLDAIKTNHADYSKNQAMSGCEDVRVYQGDYSTTDPATENTNRLPIEIVKCSHGTDPRLQIWVAVDSVNCANQSSDTKITVYYNATGKSKATDAAQYGQHDVWDDGPWGAGSNYYKAVFHMEEASGNLADSTQYNNDTTNVSGTPVYQADGMIGYGIEFASSSNEYFYDSGWTSVTTYPFTIEAWARVGDPDNTTTNVFASINDTNAVNWALIAMDCDASENCYGEASIHGGAYQWSQHTTKLWASGALHYAGTFTDNNNRQSYFNGIAGPADTGGDGTISGIDNLSIGARRAEGGVAYYHDGVIDEVRISATVRSADWLKATYNVLREPKFYITGAQDPPGSDIYQRVYEPWEPQEFVEKSSGTATTNTAGYLVDTGATFISDGVTVGDVAYNTTDTVRATVVAVTQTSLELEWDAFPDGNENYSVGPFEGNANIDTTGKLYWEHKSAGLTYGSGKPFLYRMDTAWSLLHRLTYTEIAHYFADRREKGYTVIGTFLMSAGYDEASPHHHAGHGMTTFVNKDPTSRNANFFNHVDNVLNLAADYGLYLALIVGKWDHLCDESPFDQYFDEASGCPPYTGCNKARNWGEYLGNRYKDVPNIVWVHGGDMWPNCDQTESEAQIEAMARGIEKYDPNHFQIYHPGSSSRSTYTYINGTNGYRVDENGSNVLATWLDAHSGQAVRLSWQTTHTANPIVGDDAPYILFEGCYDAKGYMDSGLNSCGTSPVFDEYMYRTQFWLTFLRGSRGHTDGSLQVYPFVFKGLHNALNCEWDELEAGGYAVAGWRDKLNTNYYQWGALANELVSKIRWWKLLPEPESATDIINDSNRGSHPYEKFASYSTEGDLVMVWFPGNCSSNCSATIYPHDLTANQSYKATWWKSTDGTLQVDTTYGSTVLVSAGGKSWTPPWNLGTMLLLEGVGDVWHIDPDCATPGDGTTGDCDGTQSDNPFDDLGDVNNVLTSLDDVYFLSDSTLYTGTTSNTEKLRVENMTGTSSAQTFQDDMKIDCYWIDGGSENYDCPGNSKPLPHLRGNSCSEVGTDSPTQDSYEGIINIVASYYRGPIQHIKVKNLEISHPASSAAIYIAGQKHGWLHDKSACKSGRGNCLYDCSDIIVDGNYIHDVDNGFIYNGGCHDSQTINNVGVWANRALYDWKYWEYHDPPYTGSCSQAVAAGMTFTGSNWSSFDNYMAGNILEYCKECLGVQYLADPVVDCTGSECVYTGDGIPGTHTLVEWNIVKTGYGVAIYPADGGNRGVTVRHNFLFEQDPNELTQYYGSDSRWTGIFADNESERDYCSYYYPEPFRFYGNIVGGLDEGNGLHVSCAYCGSTADLCFTQVRGYMFGNTLIENENNFALTQAASSNLPTITIKNNVSLASESGTSHRNYNNPNWNMTVDGNAFNTNPCTTACPWDDGATIGALYFKKGSGWHSMTSDIEWFEAATSLLASANVNAGKALTTVHANDVGSGTELIVADSFYFHGDEKIYINTATNVATITDIEYGTPGKLYLSAGLTRSSGQDVGMVPMNWATKLQGSIGFYASARDAGAIEAPQDLVPSALSPSGDNVPTSGSASLTRDPQTNQTEFAHSWSSWKFCETGACDDCTPAAQSIKSASDLTSWSYSGLNENTNYNLCARTFVDGDGTGSAQDYEGSTWKVVSVNTGSQPPQSIDANVEVGAVRNIEIAPDGAENLEIK